MYFTLFVRATAMQFVIALLGFSLANLFALRRTFSLKTSLMFADQMLARIQHLHSKHPIQRDIKPEHFVVGGGQKANMGYVINFGPLKKFRDPNDEQHISHRESKRLLGRDASLGIY